ncbi:MAG: B12-binding domain-containing radical SAM protein [Verrucomicrobia bacterium]|nr:B12-binding domain-containing radical SAM protein [Verrucomicrobiota bacterium]
MKALLISPRCPDTFWSLRHAIQFSQAKALFPPLGLLTVASMLPREWSKKVVDLNVEPLTDAHLGWADIAFISAMSIHWDSVDEVIQRCKARGLKVVAGGPHFSRWPDGYKNVDHTVIGEAEEIMPALVQDLERGQAKPVYRAENFPELAETPPPAWELINLRDYLNVSAQFSRGCPFSCEFCDVVLLFGRRPRYKSVAQIIAELDALYRAGWRGEVMFVDDNFIGNPGKAKALLTAIVGWQQEHGYPFEFFTQASLNLAENPEMLSLMSQTGFKRIFIGIETTFTDSLTECHKHQNKDQDLIEAVRTLQGAGMEVMGGFIVGFDADPPTVFDDIVRFIQAAGIPRAMIGLLSAPPGTPLWDRLEKEGRLLGFPNGDNSMSTGALNIVPKMGREKLVSGYKSMAERLYDPAAYFDRVLTFFAHHRPNSSPRRGLPTAGELKSLLAILWTLGVRDSNRRAFWSFLGQVIRKHRHLFTEAIFTAACSHHFHIISRRFISEGK